MKKLLIHCKRCAVLLLALTAAFAVSCTGDLEDDLADLTVRVEGIEGDVADLKAALDKGALVSDYTTGTDSEGRKTHVISLSDEQTITLTDGLDGEDGKPGTDGTPGTPGADAAAAVEVEEYNEFLLIKVNDTIFQASKQVSYPESLSLRGVEKIDLGLKDGETTTVTFQVNPSDVNIDITEVYLLLTENEFKPDANLDTDITASTKASELLLKEAVYMTADNSTIKSLGNGVYSVEVAWVQAVSTFNKVLVSVAYPKETYDADTKEVSTEMVEVLSATTLTTDLIVTPIEEVHVKPWTLEDEGTKAAAPVSKNYVNDDDVVQNPLKYTFMANSDCSINISALLSDYEAANIKGVALMPKSAGFNTYEAAKERYGKTGFTLYGSGSGTNVVWSDYGMGLDVDGKQMDVLSYDVDGNLNFSFVTPKIDEGTRTYALKLLIDDYYTNAKDKFVGAYIGADKKIYSIGYVYRYLEVTVVAFDETKIANEMNAWSPNTTTGVIEGVYNDGNDVAEYQLENAEDRTYTITSEAITYDYSDGDYGYMLDDDEDTIEAYQAYLDGKAAEWIKSSIEDRPLSEQHDELDVVWSMANTEAQPLLPGKYTIKVNVVATEGNDTVFNKTYFQDVNVYVPDYKVALNADMTDYGVIEETDEDIIDDYEGFYGYTYDWYDADLARYIDVTSVYADQDTGKEKVGHETKYMFNTAPVSTIYSDENITFFDFDYLRYSNSYDALDNKIMRTVEEFLKTAENKVWGYGMTATYAGVDSTPNVIEVASLPSSAAVSDVTKTVTLYISLDTGLEIPVEIYKSVVNNEYKEAQSEDSNRGEFKFTVKTNDVAATTVEFTIKDGDNVDLATTGTETDAPVSLYNINAADILKKPYTINADLDRESDVYYNLAKVARTTPAYTGKKIDNRFKGTTIDLTEATDYSEWVPAVEADKENGVVGSDKVAFIAATKPAQIGNGSADMFSTVDLISSVTYSVVANSLDIASPESATLTEMGLTTSDILLTVDADGSLGVANITYRYDVNTVMSQKIKATVVSAFGTSKDIEYTVYFNASPEK